MVKIQRICTGYIDYGLSFVNLHKMCSRATPEQMMTYKMALCLFKLYNSKFNSIELTILNFNQLLNSRQTHFKFLRTLNTKLASTLWQTDFYSSMEKSLLNGLICH